LKRFRQDPRSFSSGKAEKGHRELTAIMQAGRENFEKNMDDDFNTAGALGVLFQMVRDINSTLPDIRPESTLLNVLNEVERQIMELGEVLGLFEEKEEKISQELVDDLKNLIREVKKSPAESDKFDLLMKEIIQIRQNARKNKDWATADTIRDGLAKINVQLEDHPGGTDWKHIP
jgi:cysteinyl-tRNA synthetase